MNLGPGETAVILLIMAVTLLPLVAVPLAGIVIAAIDREFKWAVGIGLTMIIWPVSITLAVVYFTVIRRKDSAESTGPPGWYPDPADQRQSRYWNGTSWTGQVTNGGGVCSKISNR